MFLFIGIEFLLKRIIVMVAVDIYSAHSPIGAFQWPITSSTFFISFASFSLPMDVNNLWSSQKN